MAEKALGDIRPDEGGRGDADGWPKDEKAPPTKIANFWNTGFDFTSLPTDKTLHLASGADVLTDLKKNQYMTFTVNPDFNWGPQPGVKTMAGQYRTTRRRPCRPWPNGEVNMIMARRTRRPTLPSAWRRSPTRPSRPGSAMPVRNEHLDLVVHQRGRSSRPATVAHRRANAVRQAFLQTIPRQDIINRLIKPVDPSATLRNSFTQPPRSSSPPRMVAANGMSAFDKVDIAGLNLAVQAGVDQSEGPDHVLGHLGHPGSRSSS